MPSDRDFREPRSAQPRNYPEPPDRIRWEPIFPEQPEPPPTHPAPRPVPRPRRLPRIVALLMLCIALAIAAAFFRNICAFFAMIGTLAERPTEKEAFLGYAAFGLALVGFLAALRIALSSQNSRRP